MHETLLFDDIRGNQFSKIFSDKHSITVIRIAEFVILKTIANLDYFAKIHTLSDSELI
ncbi:MAG TPA: hypothetical protein VE089_06845 [Nitrososphaeraceae archaeon]|jgi:hypothetical protein|nr:hypothetical protein [Nitrososphaeraceae archaeon]